MLSFIIFVLAAQKRCNGFTIRALELLSQTTLVVEATSPVAPVPSSFREKQQHCASTKNRKTARLKTRAVLCTAS